MKTAGIALSIVGSVLSIILALIVIGTGALFSSSQFSSMLGNDSPQWMISFMTVFMLVLGTLLLASCILGILGAVKFSKKGSVSGAMLVIAAVLSAMTIYGIISAICFVISGIFAFVSDKRSKLQPMITEDKDASEEYDLGL